MHVVRTPYVIPAGEGIIYNPKKPSVFPTARLTNAVQMLQVVEFEALQQEAKPRMSPSLQVSDSSFCLCPRLLEALFRARDRAAAALTAADLGMLPNYINCCRQIGARHNNPGSALFLQSLFLFPLLNEFSILSLLLVCPPVTPFSPWHSGTPIRYILRLLQPTGHTSQIICTKEEISGEFLHEEHGCTEHVTGFILKIKMSSSNERNKVKYSPSWLGQALGKLIHLGAGGIDQHE